MYSLRLTCKPDETELLIADLHEAGTAGIRELDEDELCVLIAGFERNEFRAQLLNAFAAYAPEWHAEDTVDWSEVSRDAWRAREIGTRLFLAPYWSPEPTPHGRVRLIHNPGLACGTGEHPCTRLTVAALEQFVTSGDTVLDVGTGSGLLAIAASQLGAARAVGIDTDCAALLCARENSVLNSVHVDLVCGSADALKDACSNVTVANISATVLLSIWGDLVRVTRRPGYLIVSGFESAEAQVLEEMLPDPTIFEEDDWVCLAARLS